MKKKNSIFKNIWIVTCARYKRYPSAWFLVPLFLFAKVANPFLNSLISSKAVGAIAAGDVRNFILTIFLFLLASMNCSGIINVTESFLYAQATYTRLGVFAKKLFTKTLTTDYQNVELQKNQKILGKADNSISGDWNGPQQLMAQTLNIAVTILGIGTYGAFVLSIDWRILCVILGMFVFNVSLQTAAIKYSDKHREESSEISRKKRYLRKKSLEISAGKDVRIFQLQDWFNELFTEIIKRRRSYEARTALHWYFPTISDVMFNLARDLLAYAILIKRVLSGQMAAATFTLYIGMVGGFSSWIYSLAGNLSSLIRSSHEFNDYYEFMDLPERVSPERKNSSECKDKLQKVGQADKNQGAPEIVFKNVGFTYDGAEKATLSDLNFTIHSGEKIALVGNNGAGKTTIVKLLTGLYLNTVGEILINGKPLSNINLEDYQDNISVLFQDTTPLAFSLEENICSCEADATDKEKMSAALKKAGLYEKVELLPQKEKTYITQNLDANGILLSGGETQKLLLAKAIYKNGNFLILDEPTSALDPIAESKIYEEYNEMADGKTAVFISHRLASTKFCDKIMFLDGGKIAEFGTHEELMALGGKYKEMFDIQSQYYLGKDNGQSAQVSGENHE